MSNNHRIGMRFRKSKNGNYVTPIIEAEHFDKFQKIIEEVKLGSRLLLTVHEFNNDDGTVAETGYLSVIPKEEVDRFNKNTASNSKQDSL